MMSCMIIIMWWFFFFKQKTAYEMRISDWSSDVCSSDLSTIWWPRPPMPTAAAPPPWPLPQPTPHRTRPMNALLDRPREFAAALPGSLHSIAEKVIGHATPPQGRVQISANHFPVSRHDALAGPFPAARPLVVASFLPPP